MPDWTDEQKDAITREKCDLLVSAAAGSGKTAVLSERVLRRVTGENPVRVDKLLIVTFTEAAAAEMRQRIVDKLRDELIKNPDNTEISRQLALVPKANITTIHSFCLNIIKNNFHLIDMDPGFGVIDEVERTLMCTEAAIETINRMYEEIGAEFSKISGWLAKGKDENLAEVIIKIFGYIQSFEHPYEWLSEKIEKYNIQNDDIDSLDWIVYIKRRLRTKLSGIIGGYNKVLEFADMSGSAKHYGLYEEELRTIEAFSAACNGSWEEICKAADGVNFNTIRADKNADPDMAAHAKSLRDDLKAGCTELVSYIKSFSGQNITVSLRKAYEYLEILEKTVLTFAEIFALKKKEKNFIDFNDFEHFALKLLQDESLPVASSLREKYDEIYVDEYQDCNGVQEAIFSAIARKQNGKNCNMFMVGDVKQSIYKFRQADPGIFMNKLLNYKEKGLQSKIALNRNFRSRREIIQCVNDVFSKIMTPEICAMDYSDAESLYYGADYPDDEGVWCGGKPEILVLDKVETEENVSNIAFQTRVVADKICEMVGKYQVYDAKNKKYRPSTYRDFAILMRNPGFFIGDIEQELKNRGIPCFSDRGPGLFNVHETELIISALEIVDNPLQDIPLLGFMRSVPGGFTENDLFEIREYLKKGCFFNAVKKCASGEGKLSAKCKAFVEMIAEWRKMAKTRPVYDIIGKIMSDTFFSAYIQTLPGGKSRYANIELLCEYAKRYEASSLKGVFNFLRYVEKLEKGKGFDAAKVLSESCDVVRVMSIHKSKGLEFPVVFILGGGASFHHVDSTAGIILDKDYGIGCYYTDFDKKIQYPLISHYAVSQKIRLDNLAEEMRVLYVALTRAREKLFYLITEGDGFRKVKESIEEHINTGKHNDADEARGYFDWILASLEKSGEDCAWSISYVTPEVKEEAEEKQENADVKNVSAEQKAEIERRLFYTYPYTKSSGLSSKYSVTELKNKYNSQTDENETLFRYREEALPAFMRGEKLSAAAKGTVLHLMLKFLDIYSEDHRVAIENCKRYLIENKFISQKEADGVELSVIETFMQSEACENMRKAEKLYREIPFNICIGGDIPTGDAELKNDTVLLQGIIDCLYVKDGKFFIVDYKTDNGRQSEDELVEQYRPQLELYRIAAEKITGCEFGGAYLYFLNRGVLRNIDK